MAHDEIASLLCLPHNVGNDPNKVFPPISSMGTRTSSIPYVEAQVTIALHTIYVKSTYKLLG